MIKFFELINIGKPGTWLSFVVCASSGLSAGCGVDHRAFAERDRQLAALRAHDHRRALACLARQQCAAARAAARYRYRRSGCDDARRA